MWKVHFVNDWEQFNYIVSHFNYKRWIFRGQGNADWDLESSLYRQCKNSISELSNNHCINIEKQMIHEFKSSYKLYSNYLLTDYSKSESKIDWLEEKLSALSIMQHYGAPTRLLDWTYSPYIASFFALDGTNSDFCIYALNLDVIEANIKNRKKHAEAVYKYSVFYKDRGNNPFLYSYEPTEKNERIRKQQGLFLVPSHINMTFNDILDSYEIEEGFKHEKAAALKLVFSKEVINEWWFKLQQMNITHETLYPGLEGFCKSLKLNIINN